MEEKKKHLSRFEKWESAGTPCHYARFQQPIPPYVDSEPVSEFKLNAKTKYCVESITYTEHGHPFGVYARRTQHYAPRQFDVRAHNSLTTVRRS